MPGPPPPAALPPPPSRRIREVKERLDGSRMEFDLECWQRTERFVVARWIAPADNEFGLPTGAWSWGCWWRDRGYGAYRLHSPDGALRGYRIDAVEDVRISDSEVRYRDLVLDALIDPDGTVRIEDEAEVQAMLEGGQLGPQYERRLAALCRFLEYRTAEATGAIDAAIAGAAAHVRVTGGQ